MYTHYMKKPKYTYQASLNYIFYFFQKQISLYSDKELRGYIYGTLTRSQVLGPSIFMFFSSFNNLMF